MPTSGTTERGVARRAEIIRTAFDVIAREGYPGATLGAIARELGIETPHIVYYFGTREALLQELVERWDAESLESLPVGVPMDDLEIFGRAIRRNLAMRGIVHLYLSFAAEAVDVTHPAHDYFAWRFSRTVDSLAEVISEGQRVGAIRAERDPRRAARLLVAIADGIQLQALMDPSIDASADLDSAIADLFIGQTRHIEVSGVISRSAAADTT